MAVYTEVSEPEARRLLQDLGLGRLERLQGIEDGIENTNYFVTTSTGEWVLTLFERLSHAQLPFYLHLMQHLAESGIPVPLPQAKLPGTPVGPGEDAILHTLRGKPAAVVNRLAGHSEAAPGTRHCRQVGAMLARAHLAARSFERHQDNLRGLPWWNQTVPVVTPYVTQEQARLLRAELALQNRVAQRADYARLPRGPVHADLFRDNVMFDGPAHAPRLTGFFDWYFAGVDSWLFDLCVVLNDWALDTRAGQVLDDNHQALLAAYQSVRPLEAAEQRLLPFLLRAAALRFWLSRLWDYHLPRDASLLTPRDPTQFETVVRLRSSEPVTS
ncbi:MAG: homoserine kinase [Ottowia sp.]|nr:homoserine kinase [Ottowia sp.]